MNGWKIFIRTLPVYLCLLLAGVAVGISLKKVNPIEEPVTYISDTIAVVNLDKGIENGGELINYATQLMTFPNGKFKVMSLEEARKGVENGSFAAYILIPYTFSESVASINTRPEKAVLPYSINSNLRQDKMADVVSDINQFQAGLNTNISFMYLSAILEEFHTAQDSAGVIMKNDKADLERLLDVDVEALVSRPEFVELKNHEGEYREFDLSSWSRESDGLLDGIQEDYNASIHLAEQDYLEVKEKKEPVVGSIRSLIDYFKEVNLLINEAGSNILEAAKRNLLSLVESYNTYLEERKIFLKSFFAWPASPSDAIPATPSDAAPSTPSDADPPATPSNARQWNDRWLGKLRYTVATQSNAYQRQLDELPQRTEDLASPANALIREESTLISGLVVDDAMNRLLTSMEGQLDSDDYAILAAEVSSILEDDVLHEEMVASASNAGRADPGGSIVQMVLERIPVFSISLDEDLQSIYAEMKQVYAAQEASVEEIDTVDEVPFQIILEEGIEEQIQDSQDREKAVFDREAEDMDQALRDYEDEMERYDPFRYLDREKPEQDMREVRSILSDLDKQVGERDRENSEEKRDILDVEQKNLDALQENMDLFQETTISQVAEMMGTMQEGRKGLNEQNETLLTALTKKLSYTRNGSTADTSAYDFIINPIDGKNESKYMAPVMALRQAVAPNVFGIVAFLVIAVGFLAADNIRLRKKNQDRSE